MVIENLIGKCGIEREYFFDKSMYYEYFHNNGIIEGTLKKYMKTWADDNNYEFKLFYEVNYINGLRNGKGIRYDFFDEPRTILFYVDDKLKTYESFFLSIDGNKLHFKFIFENDNPVKIEIPLNNNKIKTINLENNRTYYNVDKNIILTYLKKDDNIIEFYYNNAGTNIDLNEFL